MNIPQIGFGTFQLYPDQNDYGFDDPTLSPFNNTVEQGIDWIKKQAECVLLLLSFFCVKLIVAIRLSQVYGSSTLVLVLY